MTEAVGQYTQTEQALAEMLVENTGRQMWDSGDYYGRNHEAQKGKTVLDFQKEPAATYEVFVPHSETTGVRIRASFSLFHWLRSRVIIDNAMTKKLWAFGDGPEYDRESWFSIAAKWVRELGAEGPPAWGREPKTVNTCNNGESNLDQVIQYTAFTLPDSENTTYLVLFVHGGCDVRSGYTRPRVFKIKPHLSFSDMLDDDRYWIEAHGDGPGGGKFRASWNEHGYPNHDGDPKPEHIPDDVWGRSLDEFEFKMGVPDSITERGNGIIYVAEDCKSATCPLTGEWLEVWPHGEF